MQIKRILLNMRFFPKQQDSKRLWNSTKKADHKKSPKLGAFQLKN
jgi:hypothetical protein